MKWVNVKLETFMACKYNLAMNRQTKYLAEYNETDFSICNMMSENKLIMEELLIRAKKTLQSLPFFGITEYNTLSQILFEKSVGNRTFKFEKYGYQSNDHTVAKQFLETMNIKTYNRIKEMNSLDIELYEYAKKLFFKRLDYHEIIY